MPFNPLMLNNKKIKLPKEKPAKPKISLRERFYCWLLILLSSILAGGLTSLLFLSLMVVDPALSTLQFVESPVSCQVVESRPVTGLTNCSRLSSCREGCTQGQAACHYIVVEFSSTVERDTVITTRPQQGGRRRAQLRVNAKGCGYSPTVNCSQWIGEFGERSQTFPCHYSKTNTAVAITKLDKGQARSEVVLSILVPILVMTSSGAGLYILNTKPVKTLVRNSSSQAAGNGEVGEESSGPSLKTTQQGRALDTDQNRLPPVDELQESGKQFSEDDFQIVSAFERFKRSADAFDIPNFPKRMRTDLSESSSSLEKLFSEKTKAKIISWRRNTKSLTDQIVMNS